MKKLLSLLVLFVLSLLTVSAASALNEENFGWAVEINGDPVFSGDIVNEDIVDNAQQSVPSVTIEEGQSLDVKVILYTGDQAVDDIEVEAKIKGYEYSDHETVSDSSSLFDLDAHTQKSVRLSFDLPGKLDKKIYWLYLTLYNSASQPVTQVVKLNVKPARHVLDIEDVIFSPGNTVKAGHSLLATVLVTNYGDKDEDNVKVTLDLPELGVSASDYIDEIESNPSKTSKETSEELFLKLPQCAEEGDYTAVVTVKYDEGYETVTKNYPLHVLANEKCQAEEQKLIITVGPETQNVVANQQAAYPVALTNAGTSAQTYTLELTAGDWAASQLSENLVVLEPGKTKVAYAYLTPSSTAAVGEKVATLNIKAGDNVLKTIYLKANVVAQEKVSSFSLRNGLEIALIVLVVVLIIIGLIIGFSRMKKDTEPEEEDKTYY